MMSDSFLVSFGSRLDVWLEKMDVRLFIGSTKEPIGVGSDDSSPDFSR